MRLTIGGVLILVGLGAAGGYVLGDKTNLDEVFSKAKGMVNQAGSLVGLIKSGEEQPEVYSPPPPFPNGVPDQQAGVISSSTETVAPMAALPVETNQAVAPPVAEPTPVVAAKPAVKAARKVRRKKKSVAKAKSQPAKKTAVRSVSKTTAAKKAAPSFVGTYVSLELITGRSVQGILDAKTGTHYILNVPGLGPLEYPIENVKNIVPAQ